MVGGVRKVNLGNDEGDEKELLTKEVDKDSEKDSQTKKRRRFVISHFLFFRCNCVLNINFLLFRTNKTTAQETKTRSGGHPDRSHTREGGLRRIHH